MSNIQTGQITKTALLVVMTLALFGCCTTEQRGDATRDATSGGGAAVGAVVPGISVIEGAAVGAGIGGLAGAVWADINNDGYVDGYMQNGTYYPGTPSGYDPTLRRVATGALGGAALGSAAGAVIPGVSVLEGAVIGAAAGPLAGAIWADQNNDGVVDGYVYNGQYYAGAPSGVTFPGYSAPAYIEAPASTAINSRCAGGPSLSLTPPQPSTSILTLDNKLFQGAGVTLNAVAKHILGALRRAGYQDQSFYCVPDGFALATAIERIRPDKTPWPGDGRWNLERVPLVDLSEGFSLWRIIDALKHADAGTYRMIIFYVTDRPITLTGVEPRADFGSLPSGGPDELPANIGRKSFGPNYRVKVLVYEFKRRSVSSPAFFVKATLPAAIHMQRSGILRALGQ